MSLAQAALLLLAAGEASLSYGIRSPVRPALLQTADTTAAATQRAAAKLLPLAGVATSCRLCGG